MTHPRLTFLRGREACPGSDRPVRNIQRDGAGWVGTCAACEGRIEVTHAKAGLAEWHVAPPAPACTDCAAGTCQPPSCAGRAALAGRRVECYTNSMTTTTDTTKMLCFACDGEGQTQVGGTSVRVCDLCDGEGVREIQSDVCPDSTCTDGVHYTGRRDPFTNEDEEAGPCTHGGFVPPF